MSMIIERVDEVKNTATPEKARWQPRWKWEHLGLGTVLLVAAFLGLWNLSINSYSNEYYAAAVKSMLQSWHNFFYVSFDPGGFVTVDKPPVAFWVQTAFAKVFGFNGVSLLLPEALAGVGGVFLIYLMVKQAFGTVAGLLSALLMAITPIFVVMNRDNNPDSILVFTLILAAWTMLRAAEKGRLRWLILAGVLVGVAFNVKMLEAYVALPAFYLMYFLFARTSWRKRVLHLALLSVVIAAISFSWAIAVDLTPASQRPYVDTSAANSELDLILNYNGLGRVDGNEMSGLRDTGNTQYALTDGTAGQAAFPGATGADDSAQPQTGFPGGGNPPATQNAPNGGPNGGAGFGGQAGITRLLTPQNAGEFNWFMPLALLGLVYLSAYAFFGMAKGEERSRRLQLVALWGGWLLVYGAVFSFSKGTFHPYYLTIMAPAQAALAGSAVVIFWKRYRRGGWQAGFLPVALATTAFYQSYILTGYTSWNWWLSPTLVVVGVCALIGLAVGRFVRYERGGRILALGVVGATVAALLVTPAAWSIRAVFTPITGSIVSGTPNGGGMGGPGGGFDRNSSSSGIAQEWLTFIQNNLSGQLMLLGMLVVAGGVLFGLRYLLRNHRFFNRPALAGVLLALFLASSSGWWINVAQAQTTSTGVSRFDGGRMGEQQANQTLVHYLETNQSDYKYLVAVSSSQSAAPIIIETGLPVMSIGGFTGSDKTITSTAQLEQLIANHTVRYFLLGGGGGPGGGSSVVSQYVQQKCTLVDSSQYSSSASSGGTSSATGSSDSRSNGFGAMGGFGGQQQLYVCGG